MNHSSLKGSCHCGLVTYSLAKSQLPDSVTECNCSICQPKGYLLWFVPATDLTVLTGAGELTKYQFGAHNIEHLFCPRCGVSPFCYGKSPNGPMAAINVRSLANVDLGNFKREPYDGRSL